MYHLAAYFATTGPITEADVPALRDDILTIQNNHFVLQSPMQLLGGVVMAANLTRARLGLPTFRQFANPYLRPFIGAAVPPTNPNFDFRHYAKMMVPPFQELQLICTDTVGTTEPLTGIIALTDGIVPFPVGDVYPLRVTSSTTAVANAWTTLALTFQDSVPPGVYTMLWSEMQSTNAQAHRWIVPNQYWRPGFLSLTALGNRLPWEYYEGRFGAMGTFRSNALPQVQVLCNGADASHEGYLAVVRTGSL